MWESSSKMTTHICRNHEKTISWEAYPYENDCPVCDDSELKEQLSFTESELESANTAYKEIMNTVYDFAEDLKNDVLKDCSHQEIAENLKDEVGI